jgi:hypothetical protein
MDMIRPSLARIVACRLTWSNKVFYLIGENTILKRKSDFQNWKGLFACSKFYSHQSFSVKEVD